MLPMLLSHKWSRSSLFYCALTVWALPVLVSLVSIHNSSATQERHEDESLLPHFNCDKIAFYKTHKTASTTVGGILFRIAAAANLSIYIARSHYAKIDHKVELAQMGTSDLFLQHVLYQRGPLWHARTRAFFAKALGSSRYGFVTTLRHPVDRYMSDYYYYTGAERLAKRLHTSLRQHAEGGEELNQMAGAFSLRSPEDVTAFAVSEQLSSGLYLPVELLDYGLGLMAVRCGWRAWQLQYTAVNANHQKGAVRYGNVTLQARPSLAELAADDPQLVELMARGNYLDGMLYAAALAAFVRLLEAAPPAVFSMAVRLADARARLSAECAAVHAAGACQASAAAAAAGGSGADADTASSAAGAAAAAAAAAAPSPPPLEGGADSDERCAVCVWYELQDKGYQAVLWRSHGRLFGDAPVPGADAPRSWPLAHLLQLASERYGHLDRQEYWHMVLGVEVEVAEPAPERPADEAAATTAAIQAAATWAVHHAGEGVQLLAIYVNGSQAVAAALHAAVGGALRACGVQCAFATARVEAGPAQSAFWRLRARARWSAFLAGPHEFMYGARGPLRGALLAVEASPYGAPERLCVPVYDWAFEPSAAAGSGGRNTTAASADAQPMGGVCVPQPCWLVTPAHSRAVDCLPVWSMPSLGGVLGRAEEEAALQAEALLGAGTRGRVQLNPHERDLQRLQVAAMRPARELPGQACTLVAGPRLNVPWCGGRRT